MLEKNQETCFGTSVQIDVKELSDLIAHEHDKHVLASAGSILWCVWCQKHARLFEHFNSLNTEQDTVGAHFFQCFQASKSCKCWTTHPCVCCASISCNAYLFVLSAARVSKTSKNKKWRIHVRYQNIAKTLKNQKKYKKRRTYVYPKPPKTKKKPKKKKQKGQNLCKTKKLKKNKMAEPMSQCLAWGQYFCFFCFFGFSR